MKILRISGSSSKHTHRLGRNRNYADHFILISGLLAVGHVSPDADAACNIGWDGFIDRSRAVSDSGHDM